MTAITRASAKQYFETGDFPTQAQFADLIDSSVFQVGASAQAIASNVSAQGNWDFKANVTVSGLTVLGSATGITPTANDSSTQLATTAFVKGLSSPITNSLSGDVNLSNTGLYFDGPTVAQGSSGTWLAEGTVTLTDTAGGANFYAKLWDGTTIIASGIQGINAANGLCHLSLSGRLASPAGNLRISVIDTTSTSGKILFNQSGNSKDSTITAIRIG